MKRVYSVKINGRTLESYNLKELLSRAVSAKRNLSRGIRLKTQFYSQVSTEDVSGAYAQSGVAVVH